MYSIMYLPPEIMLCIFGLLPPEELLDNVCKVCQSWRDLVQHHSLWNKYVYSPPGFPTCRKVAKFVEKCPMLKHIRTDVFMYNDLDVPMYSEVGIFMYSDLGVIATALVKNCSDVRTLCVTEGLWTAPQIDALVEAFPNLEAFSITLDYRDPLSVVGRICKFTNLKELNMETEITNCVSIKPIIDSCMFLLEVMSDRLVHLTLAIPKPGMQRVVSALGLFIKLEHLVLKHETDNETVVNFLPLANIKTLKCLQFESNVTDIGGLKSLYDALFTHQLPRLQKLAIILNCCELPGTVVQDICRCYPNLKSLELFEIDNTHTFEDICRLEHLERLKYINNSLLTDEATEHIARCPRLKHLNLGFRDVLTDATVVNLACCKSLESLNLMYCSILGRTLNVISEHLKNLRYLDITGTAVARRDCVALAEKMPLVKIVY